jgi:hypothetical protein
MCSSSVSSIKAALPIATVPFTHAAVAQKSTPSAVMTTAIRVRQLDVSLSTSICTCGCPSDNVAVTNAHDATMMINISPISELPLMTPPAARSRTLAVISSPRSTSAAAPTQTTILSNFVVGGSGGMGDYLNSKQMLAEQRTATPFGLPLA